MFVKNKNKKKRLVGIYVCRKKQILAKKMHAWKKTWNIQETANILIVEPVGVGAVVGKAVEIRLKGSFYALIKT